MEAPLNARHKTIHHNFDESNHKDIRNLMELKKKTLWNVKYDGMLGKAVSAKIYVVCRKLQKETNDKQKDTQ